MDSVTVSLLYVVPLNKAQHGTGQSYCIIIFGRGHPVNILGVSIHTVKKKAEALVVATKEIGLEVNADKTKYTVMSREQTAGLSHTMKVDNSSIERVVEFKYLGTTLTNQNSIQKEIKSRLKLGNACYHSV